MARKLSKEQQALLSKARVLGAQRSLPIYLEDGELLRLISVALKDLGKERLVEGLPELPKGSASYYEISAQWFKESVPSSTTFENVFQTVIEKLRDFDTYFKCLCELHKRRLKYSAILESQPFPTMIQISPRALLEYGVITTPALASWLVWRKWLFDLDNRAGQETGYLFEPILANALGGIPFGSKNSPIKRSSDSKKGRQVDCIVGKIAYEFKLRVTIAASGQGRFGQELEFAADCKKSGFKPVLLVLDPTPSDRLTELTAEFKSRGGHAYLGQDAWDHLEKEAGPTMSTFIEKYVRAPIDKLGKDQPELLDLALSVAPDKKSVQLAFSRKKEQGATLKWTISRKERSELADDDDE